MDAPKLDLHRGDVVLAVAGGDYGKPRPAVIVQSDVFIETHASITICPVTSSLSEAPLFRVALEPAPSNGLRRRSQIMIDKLASLRRDRIRARIGEITPFQLQSVEASLRLWLRL